MRGLACVVMFQTHCYDAWLNPAARQTKFFMWSQIGGTLPAPLFLFLAGISFALVTDKLIEKGYPAAAIARKAIRRGAEVFGLGLLFRLQEYLIAWGWAPWSDLFRVDILNTIGVSMMLMGVVCWATLAAGGRRRGVRAAVASGTAALISLITPMLWTGWQPGWLPWPIESYINGVHNLGVPQPWLFPIFPWSAFAFAGLAGGFLILEPGIRGREWMALPAGIGVVYLSKWMEALPGHFYQVEDYWHTSPEFFLLRVGVLLMVLGVVYCWCQWRAGQWGFSPMIQLGQTSLLVYWVHIEFVYGRFSILRKHEQSIGMATAGLLMIFLMMLGLSLLRTNWKKIRSRRVSQVDAVGI
jgi:uncharacterized membrane protein